MSPWKPGSKKSKKSHEPRPTEDEFPANEASSVLPDVIADLSLDSPGNPTSIEERIMLGYPSQFQHPQEVTGRRREGRQRALRKDMQPQAMAQEGSSFMAPILTSDHQPMPLHGQHQPVVTPYGLGAASTTYFLPQESHDVSQKRWPNSDSDHQAWNFLQSQQAAKMEELSALTNDNFSHNMGPPIGGNFNTGVPSRFHELRMRSMSSDPYCHRTERVTDQKVRSSSATRSRQPRPRHKIPHPGYFPVLPESQLSPSQYPPDFPNPGRQMMESQVPHCQSSEEAENRRHMRQRKTTSHYQEDSCHGTQEGVRETLNPVSKQTKIHNAGYGYQIPDLEALLTEASPSRPANLPMVLSSPARLHNMRRSQETHMGTSEVRPLLPLGIIVNAVFKTRDWLYVRTAHGAEGYVPFRVCIPLGILPQRALQPNSGVSQDVINENSVSNPWEVRRNEASLCLFESDPNFTTEESQPRGRSRVRRRANNPTNNQTDIQKLQPTSRNYSVRNQQSVENQNTSSNISHLV